MDELTARKQQILRAVVIEYVESAEPVGSGLIVERYHLGVGPATVRHELADMSERGYLEQPHTSAGRIPSDIGYRYYVNRLSQPEVPHEADKQLRDIRKGEYDLENLLQETCKVLSRLTHHASVATTVGERGLLIQGVTLTGITKERALLAVLFSNGMVENRVIEAHASITLQDIHEIATQFNLSVGGQRLRQIARTPMPTMPSLSPVAAELATNAWRSLRAICKSASAGKTVTDGTQYLMEQPEFQRDAKALSHIVSAVEKEETVQSVLASGEESGTSVSIGRENADDALKQIAIIASRFYINDDEAGAVAVVGPTRMRYNSTVPLVDAAAKALTEALSRLVR